MYDYIIAFETLHSKVETSVHKIREQCLLYVSIALPRTEPIYIFKANVCSVFELLFMNELHSL